MIGTYLLTTFGCTPVVIAPFLGVARCFAESRWNTHPLAQVSQKRAAGFSLQF